MTDSIKEIEKRWRGSHVPMPEMVFTGHVKRDIDALLAEIKRLKSYEKAWVAEHYGEEYFE